MTRDGCVVLVFRRYNRNSLAALAGALEKTGEATLKILSDSPHLPEQVIRLSRRHGRVIVGFSFGTFNLIDAAKSVGRLRRELASRRVRNVVLVAGGAHASGCPEDVLKIGFDVAVIGEGEETFPVLVRKILDGASLDSVCGVAFVRDGELVSTPRARPVELDAYPPFSARAGIFSQTEITRGCPRACRFCQVSRLFGARFRHRSPERIEEATRELVASGRRDIRFVSPDSLSYGVEGDEKPRLDRLEEMLRRVAEVRGVRRVYFGSFPSELFPLSVTPEALRIIKRYASNEHVIVGAQSGSDRVLGLMNRRHTVEDVRRAVRLIMSSGFGCDVDFIVGYPGEDFADREATLKFMREIAEMGARVHFHVFVPLVGTPHAEAQPARIESDIEREFDKLAGEGRAFGSWRRQQERFARVHEFRKRLRDSLFPEVLEEPLAE